jgi:hypothetical protein
MNHLLDNRSSRSRSTQHIHSHAGPTLVGGMDDGKTTIKRSSLFHSLSITSVSASDLSHFWIPVQEQHAVLFGNG